MGTGMVPLDFREDLLERVEVSGGGPYSIVGVVPRRQDTCSMEGGAGKQRTSPCN